MRKIAFLPQGFDDFNWWISHDKKTYNRLVKLIRDIERDPFNGLGKPEPLKHELQGLWSRRMTDEHRLVYAVTDEEIVIVACRFHY